MGMSWHESEVRRLLKEHDAEFIRNARHGDLWRFPNGNTVMVLPKGKGVSENKDPYKWRNSYGDVRRAIGLSYQEEPVEEAPEEEESMSNHQELAQLAALGVHVETKKRVIEEVSDVAVIPVASIAKILGWSHEDVKLIDVNGVEIQGPVTLRGASVVERTS